MLLIVCRGGGGGKTLGVEDQTLSKPLEIGQHDPSSNRVYIPKEEDS